MNRFNEVFDNFTESNIFPKSASYNILESSRRYVSAKSSANDSSIQSYRPPKEQLRALVGKVIKYPEVIGPHPDFANLKMGETEKHYAVSVFADIQGSTILGTKFTLEQVRFIKNGILTTAIDIFQAFDGHVHRLQGDAIFVFFGRKNITKYDSIVDALNASASLQEFCKSSLAPKFEELGFPSIRIRIGIDFGDDHQVLWSHYGIKNCNEITTTSVHTDLAAKMQHKSPAGGIIIGDNVREYLDLPDEFYTIRKRTKNGELIEDGFVINNAHMKYRMWLFDWERYLNRFLLFPREPKFSYRAPNDFKYRCFYRYSGEENYPHEYLANCGSLPKECHLKFSLEIPSWLRYTEIEWKVLNRGLEAKNEDSLDFDMPDFMNRTFCLQSTAYKGHHYMLCTIKNQGRIIAQEHFGVFVRN